MKLNFKDIKARAHGNWDEIYKNFNVPVFPKNKHKPCPICGGTDRFRYDDKHGNGDYICGQCDIMAGDGFTLLSGVDHITTQEAFTKVAEYLGMTDNAQSNKQFIEAPAGNIHKMNFEIQSAQICADYKDSTEAAKNAQKRTQLATLGQSVYLENKGLKMDLPLIGEDIFIQLYNIEGDITGGQTITKEGDKKLLKGTKKRGSFILISNGQLQATNQKELISKAKTIVICEGLATGISVSELQPKALIVIAIDSGNLLPVGEIINAHAHNRIIIAADNDQHNDKNVGVIKAEEAAHAINALIAIPSDFKGTDWDDYRQEYGIEAATEAFNEAIKPPAALPKEAQTQPQTTERAPLRSNSASSDRVEYLIDEYNERLSEINARIPIFQKAKQGFIYFDNGAYDLEAKL